MAKIWKFKFISSAFVKCNHFIELIKQMHALELFVFTLHYIPFTPPKIHDYELKFACVICAPGFKMVANIILIKLYTFIYISLHSSTQNINGSTKMNVIFVYFSHHVTWVLLMWWMWIARDAIKALNYAIKTHCMCATFKSHRKNRI